jgi:hypothetical protein
MLGEIRYKEGKCMELTKDHVMDGFGISSVELHL